MGNKLNYIDFKNSISYMPQNINLINDNIEKRFHDAGFTEIKSESHFMTRVWSGKKFKN